jgi:hypothetical protein
MPYDDPMRTTIKLGTGLLGLVAAALPALAKERAGAKEATVGWARSWSDAVQEATERNVPIFLHSHAAT